MAELGLQNAADVLKSPLVVPLDARELSLQLAEEALLNGSTFHGDLDRIRITDIQRIEVLKGPAAATLYGRQASTDVINFTPRLDYSGIRLNGSWTLSEFLPPLNRLWVSTEHDGECDATNGVQRPFWTLFPDHDWAGPAFGDDGNTWFYGSQEEGFTLPGYKYPKLGPFGLPQTDFTDPDSLRKTGFTVLADLVERVENDPSMSEEARSAFMGGLGFILAFGGPLAVSDLAAAFGDFDPDEIFDELKAYSAGAVTGTAARAGSPNTDRR